MRQTWMLTTRASITVVLREREAPASIVAAGFSRTPKP
jgi:hypothetical protein